MQISNCSKLYNQRMQSRYLIIKIRQKMTKYSNKGRDSGILAYEISLSEISVKFSDGSVYRYSYDSAGRDNVEQMKKLAQQGEGLNSFINKYVKFKYVR